MASQENDKAMDGLLRRSLARDGDSSSSAKGECPDPELLASYYDKSLSATEVAALDLHFSQCARCREQIAAIVRADVEVEKDSSTELVPVGAAAPARAPQNRVASLPRVGATPLQLPKIAKSPDAARRPLLHLRWLAPLAAAIILAVFVYTRVLPHRSSVGSNNEIAMNAEPPAPQGQSSVEPEPAPGKSEAPIRTPTPNSASHSAAPSKRSNAPSPSAAPAQSPREEKYVARGGAASASAGKVAPKTSAASQRADTESAADEPAPAAPPPQSSASLPGVTVAANSAEGVAIPPPPAPPADSAKKSNPAQVTGQAFGYSAGKKSLAKSQPARERSSQIVIRTPDSDVAYRIADGGFIEQTEDGGATWQGQLLNPAADITAGSAPAPSICWLVGRAGVIFLTEDGKNWRKLLSPSSSDFVAVVAKSATSATVTVTEEEKWSTDDAGKTWRPQK
jgi:hypothetical protein